MPNYVYEGPAQSFGHEGKEHKPGDTVHDIDENTVKRLVLGGHRFRGVTVEPEMAPTTVESVLEANKVDAAAAREQDQQQRPKPTDTTKR